MWTSLNKKLYLFLSIILAIGIILGIIFVIMLDESTKEIIFLNINEMIQNFKQIKINNIIIHLIILAVLFLLSMFIIGAPVIVFAIFYNGFSLGFIITSLTYIFGIKGLLYSFAYVLISKGIFLILLIIYSVTLLKIIKNLISKVINKGKGRDTIIIMSKKALLIAGFILISDIIIYFGGAKLINLFNFLII